MKQTEFPDNIPLITKQNLRLLFPNISEFTFDKNIQNWLKNNKLIALKKGLYVFSTYWQQQRWEGDSYLEFLANKIYHPSYLSMEYVLQKYSMLSEAVFAFTSVSPKAGRVFKNKLGTFSFSAIKPELFTGWATVNVGNNQVFMASKAKALFDYLYLYKRKIISVNKKQLDELRLNLEEMSRQDWQEFDQYVHVSGSIKMKKIFKILFTQYAD